MCREEFSMQAGKRRGGAMGCFTPEPDPFLFLEASFLTGLGLSDGRQRAMDTLRTNYRCRDIDRQKGL